MSSHSETTVDGADAESRVLMVSQHYPPDSSGNASRVRDTASHLVDRGFDVTVVTPPPAFPHGQFDRVWSRKQERQLDGVTVVQLWAWVPNEQDPSFLSRILYYLTFPLHALLWLLPAVGDYDVTVTSAPPIFTGIVGVPTVIDGSCLWVVDVRDLWIDASVELGFIEAGSLFERLSRLYQWAVLSASGTVLVTTPELGRSLVDQYGIDREKVVHAPNGVDATRFEPHGTDEEPVIVYTGNVGHAQDLESCVRAMAHVDYPSATLRIVGDGDCKQELEELVDSLDLTERVEFTGLVPRDEIPDILGRAAIGVAPLKDDDALEYAVPTKAYEYMASGLPVVATGTGEIERLMASSESGMIVGNDPQALAEAFSTLLESPSKRRTMGENGREHIESHYDRRAIAERLVRVFEPSQ